jgi:hypothetical protein
VKPAFRTPFAALIVGSVLTAAACGPTLAGQMSPGPETPATVIFDPVPSQPPTERTVSDALAEIAIKGRAPKTGYDRDEFGPAWADVDHNGCDTRNDILARDLHDEVVRADRCTVATGVLEDPYTGERIEFTRGPDSADVQIDHLVPLSDAWQKGAQSWDEAKREAFANDPMNLQATDGPTNGAKGDGDAATWLPPNRSIWCAYVALQTEVKWRYGLWMTQAEHDRIAEILGGCEPQPLGKAIGGMSPVQG